MVTSGGLGSSYRLAAFIRLNRPQGLSQGPYGQRMGAAEGIMEVHANM
ncbi:MAG: hypothetical protein PWR07_1282 [Bacillota bacterium]|nr:hypothetical protein [Bacillota bacterium]